MSASSEDAERTDAQSRALLTLSHTVTAPVYPASYTGGL